MKPESINTSVTAVVTTHKRKAEIVERALVSIINQTYQNIEIIVVDDSPSDYAFRDSVKIMIKKYDKVKYIQHEICQGACVARNTALSAAHGEYIAYLDDDDEWKPQKIQKQLEAFPDSETALVYCGYEILNESNNKLTEKCTKYINGYVYDTLIKYNFIGSTSFPLIRTDCLRSIGGFDPLMQSAQDYDVWLRLSQKYRITYVRDTLVTYHIHDADQITKSTLKTLRGLERINEKNHDYLQTHKRIKHIRLIKLCPYYADAKEWKKCFRTLLEAVVLSPFDIKLNFKVTASVTRRIIIKRNG